MWESKEHKRRAYMQMYGGFNPDTVIQLTQSQIDAACKAREMASNICMEVPLGLGKSMECILPYPTKEVTNYKLLLL